jgi:hypothetical protein
MTFEDKVVILVEMFVRCLKILENMDEINKRRFIQNQIDFLVCFVKLLKDE